MLHRGTRFQDPIDCGPEHGRRGHLTRSDTEARSTARLAHRFSTRRNRYYGHPGLLSGNLPDEPTALEELAREGMKRDVLILSGGVSMGEFDFVPGVLEKLGCKILFAGVSIQPGKPVVVAVRPGGLVFGLPGNPASAMVAFWILVRPALRRLMDCKIPTGTEPSPGDSRRHCPGPADAIASCPAGALRRRRDPRRAGASLGSHDLAAYARGTALVRVPAGRKSSRPAPPAPFFRWQTGRVPEASRPGARSPSREGDRLLLRGAMVSSPGHSHFIVVVFPFITQAHGARERERGDRHGSDTRGAALSR